MKTRFTALYITNFWGVLNDNFLKTLASFIAIRWVVEQYQTIFIGAAAAALVLPYIFFSPLAGRLTQITSKKRIIRIAKWAELFIVALAVMGFVLQSIWVVLASIVLMGLQSALYSPAKYSLIRDIGGYQNISIGMGGMEAISFIAMISGIVVASYIVDFAIVEIQYISLIVFALLGLVFSYTIQTNEEYDHDYLPINPISYFKRLRKIALQHKGINPIIYALSCFWWYAATLQMGLIVYCQSILNLSSFHTGLILAISGIGIAIGSALVGIWDKRLSLFTYVAYFALIVAVLTLVLFFVPMSPLCFAILLFVITIFAGLFKTPLDIEIQKRIKGSLLNQFLAYFNQISFVFILFASLTLSLLSLFLTIDYMFLMLGLAFLIIPIALLFNCRPMICFVVRQLLHLRYEVKIEGMQHLTDKKKHLILPNHVAVIDPIILFAEFYEQTIQPLVDEGYFKSFIFRKILSLFDAICVPDLGRGRNNVEQALMLRKKAINGLSDGGNVLFYPSGHITLNGVETIGNRQLAHHVCGHLPENTEVLLVRTTGLWGSSFSRANAKKTPNIGLTLLKNTAWVVCGGSLWGKKRTVQITLEPMTKQIIEWAQLDRRAFNQKLEAWYNRP